MLRVVTDIPPRAIQKSGSTTLHHCESRRLTLLLLSRCPGLLEVKNNDGKIPYETVTPKVREAIDEFKRFCNRFELSELPEHSSSDTVVLRATDRGWTAGEPGYKDVVLKLIKNKKTWSNEVEKRRSLHHESVMPIICHSESKEFTKTEDWKPGKIASCNDDGTYQIDYDDGHKEDAVKAEHIRIYTIRAGDRVTCTSRGGAPGRVLGRHTRRVRSLGSGPSRSHETSPNSPNIKSKN